MVMNKWEAMDKTAPLPFVRRCPDHVLETTKFVFEREKTSEETVKTKDKDGKVTTITSVKTFTKEVKITLKVYKHSAEEDAEHFFDAFEHLRKHMKTEWSTSSSKKGNDAESLFDAFDEMTEGTANTDWHDVLGNESSRTWEMFKTKVSEYISTKVLPPNAYNQQVNYMTERAKPMKLTAQQWWARYQTLNSRLPYLIRNMERLKEEFPGTDFGKWWIEGSISPAASKRVILNKIPQQWDRQLTRNDVGNEHRDSKDTQRLIEWFTNLEVDEEKDKEKKKERGKQPQQNSSSDNRRRRDDYQPRERYRQRSGHGRDQYRTGRQSYNSNYNDRDRRYSGGQRERRRDYDRPGNRDRNNRTEDHKRPANREEAHVQQERSDDDYEEAHLIDVWNDQFNYESSSSGTERDSAHYYSEGSTSSYDDEDRRGRR